MALEYSIRYRCDWCSKRSPELIEDTGIPSSWEQAGTNWNYFDGIPLEDPRFSVKHFCIPDHRIQYEGKFGKLPDYNIK